MFFYDDKETWLKEIDLKDQYTPDVYGKAFFAALSAASVSRFSLSCSLLASSARILTCASSSWFSFSNRLSISFECSSLALSIRLPIASVLAFSPSINLASAFPCAAIASSSAASAARRRAALAACGSVGPPPIYTNGLNSFLDTSANFLTAFVALVV